MSTSRLETTRLLAKVFNIEDFLSPDSLSHDELNYYNSITRVLDRHVDKYVDWLGTAEAQEAFYQESVQRKEYFNSIEDELDEIINDHTLNADRIIEKIYRKGLNKGYKDIKKYPVFNDACKYGLKATQDYNFELITKLSDDLRETIKHDIFKGIAEEKSVHEVARSITDAGLKPLKDKTLTAYQRASLIARTEISRSMSTGRLQAYANYGVEKVRILTAGDSNVCPICLKAAEKVYTLKEAQGLIPFHPACRCSIIAVIEHVVNEDGSINHDVLDKLLKKPIDGNVIDLTPKNKVLIDIFNRFSDHEYSTKLKGFNDDEWTRKNIRKNLKNHIDSNEVNKVSDAIYDFIQSTRTNANEGLTTYNAKLRPISKFIPGNSERFSDVPLSDINKVKYSYFGLIGHSHPKSRIPLPDWDDIQTGVVNLNVKYNFIYAPGFGVVVIKKDNPTEKKDEKILKKAYFKGNRERLIYLDKNISRAINEYKKNKKSVSLLRERKERKNIQNAVRHSNFKEQCEFYNDKLKQYGVELIYITP